MEIHHIYLFGRFAVARGRGSSVWAVTRVQLQVDHLFELSSLLNISIHYRRHSMGLPYLSISSGGLGGQCRHIWHTWSVWVLHMILCPCNEKHPPNH